MVCEKDITTEQALETVELYVQWLTVGGHIPYAKINNTLVKKAITKLIEEVKNGSK